MKPNKPLGHRAYGNIGHLYDSRRGPKDHGLHIGQHNICVLKPRDKHDLIIVQEKIDGTNVAVAKINNTIIPLIRAGYKAIDSHYEQHRLFAHWVFERWDIFDKLLCEGERVCGEWLAQAHGTRYLVDEHSVFVVFDIMTHGHRRIIYNDFFDRISSTGLQTISTIHIGKSLSIDHAITLLGQHGFHNAIDLPEGAIWRVERKRQVDFLAKYVRPDKIDGCYLVDKDKNQLKPTWNWHPNLTP